MHLSGPLREWLLAPDADPSVRTFVRAELMDRGADDPELAADRAAIGREGWVAKFLALQLPEGQWDNPGTTFADLYLPKYLATNWRLIILGELGATRALPGVARGVELWLSRTAPPEDSMGGVGSEVCFTGNAVRTAHALGFGDDRRVALATDWLVSSQKDDGGWHCDPQSATGTLDGWEAMAAFAAIPPERHTAGVRRAVERGAEFYLGRGLLTEGPSLYEPWTRLHYPVHYYYDYLVGLEFLAALGYADDPRLRPALDRLEGSRDAHGRWRLEALHPDFGPGADYSVRTPYYPVALEPLGEPSRWITARALRVLRRAGRGEGGS